MFMIPILMQTISTLVLAKMTDYLFVLRDPCCQPLKIFGEWLTKRMLV